MSTQYNGWTNYETWKMKLWIDTDEGNDRFWQSEARNMLVVADGDKDAASAMLAGRLKVHFNAAHREVNWDEIADVLLGDVDPFCRFS